MFDTITAISTPLGVGAISIVRVSGPEAINIVNKIFSNNLCEKDTNTINYGNIVYNDEIIDEVLVSVMKAPKTFTTEDIVEINCHGGIATTNKVLEVLLNLGCRLANPGEFTERAFLNGRINLEEAEGVMNLINAKTEKARKLSINQLSGKTTDLIKNLKSDIGDILANIQVNIDFPEYEDIEIVINGMDVYLFSFIPCYYDGQEEGGERLGWSAYKNDLWTDYKIIPTSLWEVSAKWAYWIDRDSTGANRGITGGRKEIDFVWYFESEDSETVHDYFESIMLTSNSVQMIVENL